MAHLKLSFLGAFRATVDGQAVIFRSDKERALLAYLTVESDRPHPREVLAALLWPDYSDEAARKNLRNSLHRLRQALAPDGGPETPFLLATPGDVRFCPDSDHTLDTRAFGDLLAVCRSHRHRRIAACPTCHASLARAVELYRGEFLAAFSPADSQPFEEWASVLRESLHREMVLACHTLAAFHLQHGDYAQVEAYARRQLALEPWHEGAHLQLMQALSGSGQRSAALAQYEACRRLLADGLGTEPGTTLNDAVERLRRGEALHTIPPLQMPEFPTPFFGRDEELACLAAGLAAPDTRLYTLTGLGGAGKTRLAVEAARQHHGTFSDGVFFVPLEEIASPDALAGAVVTTLGLAFADGKPLHAQLLEHLRSKEMLLVLDNCDHLTEAVASLCRDILRAAPRVTLLCTSREPLNLQTEGRFPVPGLPIPPALSEDARHRRVADWEEYPAIALFLDRARRVRPGLTLDQDTLPHVLDICLLLDGQPLGLELAAAALRYRTPADVLHALAQDLAVLTTDQPDVRRRHRSLGAVLDFCWERLTPQEQEILPQLTVFKGGWDRAAAQAVTGACPEVLGALEEKSLLRQTALGRLELHPLVRRFAAGKLAAALGSDPTAVVVRLSRRHSQHYLWLASILETNPGNPASKDSLEAIRADWHNIRAAWQWACQHGDYAALFPAGRQLFWYYELRDAFEEGRQLFSQVAIAVDAAAARDPEAATARALGLAAEGWFLWRKARSILPFEVSSPTDFDMARARAEECLAILRRLGRESLGAEAHLVLGLILLRTREFARAEEELRACVRLHEAQDNLSGKAYGLHAQALLHYYRRDLERSAACLHECLTLFETCGDRRGVALVFDSLGDLAVQRGNPVQAQHFYERSYALMEAQEYAWGMALEAYELGRVAASLGALDRARREHLRSLALLERCDDRLGMAENQRMLGVIALQAGDPAIAKQHLLAALDIGLHQRAEAILPPTLHALGEWHAACGDPSRAAGLWALVARSPASPHDFRVRSTQRLAEAGSPLPREAVEREAGGRGLRLTASLWAAANEELGSAAPTAETQVSFVAPCGLCKTR